jgi:hypothetical protein
MPKLVFIGLWFSFLFACGLASGQIPTTSADDTVQTFNERVSRIIAKSEDHFRKGMLNIDEGRRQAARDEFDQAVDIILECGLDVRANERLRMFYTSLVERIYREEIPVKSRLNSKNNERLLQQAEARRTHQQKMLAECEDRIKDAREIVNLTRERPANKKHSWRSKAHERN